MPCLKFRMFDEAGLGAPITDAFTGKVIAYGKFSSCSILHANSQTNISFALKNCLDKKNHCSATYTMCYVCQRIILNNKINNRITYFIICSSSSQETKHCGAPCHALFFKENERTILRYWVGSWAAICCASCLFTVISSRFSRIY